jgi:DHA1 family bicyclomycin/chloramphenicol resistance-like MFS transporter
MNAIPSRHAGTFLLILAGTVIGIAGTDLILPAVPGLPAILGGDLPRAQLVLASFTAGAAAGLLAFGELGARLDQRRLLAASLFAYGLASLLCGLSPSLDVLIALRFMQGAAGAAAAVFAPGLLRLLYGDAARSVRSGCLGASNRCPRARAAGGIVAARPVELAGQLRRAWPCSAWCLPRSSCCITAILPRPAASRTGGGYARLLRDPVFMRLCAEPCLHAGRAAGVRLRCADVFTTVLGGGIGDFITMQISGIACFVVASNMAGMLARRNGAERMILIGNAISAAGGVGMLGYALSGGTNIWGVTAIFLLFNIGLGLRGPPGFHRAVVASQGDDARGAALVGDCQDFRVWAGD